MNWRWLVPLWGLRVALDDYVYNYANDYMDKRVFLIVIYQLFVVSLLITIVCLNIM